MDAGQMQQQRHHMTTHSLYLSSSLACRTNAFTILSTITRVDDDTKNVVVNGLAIFA